MNLWSHARFCLSVKIIKVLHLVGAGRPWQWVSILFTCGFDTCCSLPGGGAGALGAGPPGVHAADPPPGPRHQCHRQCSRRHRGPAGGAGSAQQPLQVCVGMEGWVEKWGRGWGRQGRVHQTVSLWRPCGRHNLLIPFYIALLSDHFLYSAIIRSLLI